MKEQLSSKKSRFVIRPIDAMEGLAIAGGLPKFAERLGEFADHEAWAELAFISKCRNRGTAKLIYLSDNCVLERDDSIKIAGQGVYQPPGPKLIATFDVLTQGYYMCTARLSRPTTFSGSSEFKIDQNRLAILPVKPEPTNYSFLVELTPGDHRFTLTSITATFWFHCLSILNIPILSP